jgi:aminoglycoside phosphotransferase family enzyme
MHHADLKCQFTGLYGEGTALCDCLEFQTANGVLRVLRKADFERDIGPLTKDIQTEQQPSIAAMDFSLDDLTVLETYLDQAGVEYKPIENGLVLDNVTQTANTLFRFFQTL